jgi:hypothetical protein
MCLSSFHAVCSLNYIKILLQISLNLYWVMLIECACNFSVGYRISTKECLIQHFAVLDSFPVCDMFTTYSNH